MLIEREILNAVSIRPEEQEAEVESVERSGGLRISGKIDFLIWRVHLLG